MAGKTSSRLVLAASQRLEPWLVRAELFAQVVAALLQLSNDRLLFLGLAEHQRAVFRIQRPRVVETRPEVLDGLLEVLELLLDSDQLGADILVRWVIGHPFTLAARPTRG